MQKKRGMVAYSMSLSIVLISIFATMQSNLIYENSKEVSIIDGDERVTFTTEAEKVVEALVNSEVRFGNFDELSVELDDDIYDGIEIIITRANSVIINDGGLRSQIMTTESTVDNILQTNNIEIGDDDEVTLIKTIYTPTGEKHITPSHLNVVDGVEIELTRVEFEYESEYEYIDLEVEYIYTDDLLEGEREVRVEGEPEILEHVMIKTFRNGVYICTDEFETHVVSAGVSEVVAIGTYQPPPLDPEPEPEDVTSEEIAPSPVDAASEETASSPVDVASEEIALSPVDVAPEETAPSPVDVAPEEIVPSSDVASEETAPSPATENVSPLKSFTASLTFYNANCDGCSGFVATGHDVTSSIVFNDQQFGTVRIAAAGSQYPFGTILDIEGHGIAIVLDRGGAVVGNVVDLLIEESQDPWVYGRQSRYVRILRLGW